MPDARLLTLLAATLLVLVSPPMVAAAGLPGGADGGAQPEWFAMSAGLLGGLALFLHGMGQMAGALTALAGSRLKQVLGRLTSNRFTSMLTGTAVTAVIQSSSVTTVLVVGFVASGAMTLGQSVGVIIGANVGTTITGQIVAFNISAAALPMIALGFAMNFIAKADQPRHYGAMIMGLGLLFFGMTIMGTAMAPLRNYQPFLDLIRSTASPFPAILIAAIFTGLIQSSSATLGIVIVMAAQGFITLEIGIALSFGASLGTCITALLAAIGKPREAVRAAAVHVAFNVIGVGVFIWLIPVLAAVATAISPASVLDDPTARAAAEVPRQIANSYTVFKVLCAAMCLPFTGHLARLVTRLVPDAPTQAADSSAARYLDEALLDAPDFALQRIRLEVAHMGDVVAEMLTTTRGAVQQRDPALLSQAAARDDVVDRLQEQVLAYMALARKRPLTDGQSNEFAELVAAVAHVEAAGDVVANTLVPLCRRLLDNEIQPSETARLALEEIEAEVEVAFLKAVDAVRHQDATRAKEVTAIHQSANHAIQTLLRFQADRFAVNDPAHLANVRLETELMEAQKRLASLAARLARGVADRE